jgi:voltage-gated potassium channel
MQNEEKKWNVWDTIIFALSIYVLLQLATEVIVIFPSSLLEVFTAIDFGICIIFLADWVYFFIKAENKKKYFWAHFIDLVSSIPLVSILRPFRIFRIVKFFRSLRLLRGLKGISPILRLILGNPARSALTIYLSLTAVIFLYCSIGLYTFEFGVNKSIRNFGDVLWMSFTTLTTVGYGDLYPITTGGRLLCVVLIITGLGLFSLATGEIAVKILKLLKREETAKS